MPKATQEKHAGDSRFFDSFFTAEEGLARHFKERSRQMPFRGTGAAAAKKWQAEARAKLSELLGLHHFASCAAQPVKMGVARLENLVREEWRIQTERGVWLTYYLLIPAGVNVRRPLLLCPHGHGSAGKWAPAGRWDVPEMRDSLKQHNYDYGMQLARAGFITACPDARGFGQRREPAQQKDAANPKLLTANSCHELTLAGAPLGIPVQGMWAWDLMRLLDHLLKDPRIDSKRVGCAGLSGGGLQTLNLTALDTRIRAAVVSGYFYGVKESLQMLNGNCMCNLVPHLWENFDMGDLGALAAPRALLIQSGDHDPLNGASKLKNVVSQVKIARKVFAALNASKQLKHDVFAGEHRWDGKVAIPWLARQLGAYSTSSRDKPPRAATMDA